MVELLVKYRNKINWKYIDEWTYSGGFTSTENGDGIYELNKISNTDNDILISKNILKVGKKYKITGLYHITSGSFKIKNGSQVLNYITGGDSFSLVFTATDAKLEIESTWETNEWSISEFIIEEDGYTSLDLYDEPGILLNFSISDIRDYSKRMGTFSKNFTIPGTNKNNDFFDYVFDINTQSKLGMLEKCEAVISDGGVTLSQGYIWIDGVNKLDKVNEYSLQFYGEQLNLFNLIGDDYLESLDFSELNHTLTEYDPLYSWIDLDYFHYVYPWLDYGRDWGLGGEFGRITDDAPSCGVTPHDMFPAIQVKYILDKIMTKYGFSYDSEFLNSSEFKKIILPYVNNIEELYGWHTVTKTNHGGMVMNERRCEDFHLDITTPETVNLGFYTNETMKAGHDGIPSYYDDGGYVYKINKVIELYRRFNYGPFLVSNLGYPGVQGYDGTPNPNCYQVHQNHIPGSYLVPHDGKYRMTLTYKIEQWENISQDERDGLKIYACKLNKKYVMRDGIVMFDDNSHENSWYIYDETTDVPTLVDSRTGSTSGYVTTTGVTIDCEAGDEIYFKMKGVNHLLEHHVWQARVSSIEIEEYGYGEGIDIDMNKVLPKNVKIKDFIKDLVLLFNLYIDIDADDSSNLLIETRDDYYSSGSTLDWSSKIDISQQINLTKPTDYQSLINKLMYKEDKDYLNLQFNNEKDILKVGYGGKKFIYQNDVLDGEQTTKLSVFAPTIINDIWDVNGDGGKPQFVVSRLWNGAYPKTDESPRFEYQTEWVPRLLYFNNIDIGYNTETQTRFNYNGNVNQAGMYNKYKYPYCGHILDPFNLDDTQDLNFETALKINGTYQKTFTGGPLVDNKQIMTNNNCFNKYYSNQINQNTNKDASLLIGYFLLDSTDISKLNLADKVFVNGSYFYINKIVDYNPAQNKSLTKVELLKVLDLSDVSYTSYEESDGLGFDRPSIYGYTDFEKEIDFTSENIDNSNCNSIILGQGNFVTVCSALLNTDNSIVHSPSVLINSENITVNSGLSSVTTINERGLVINEGAVYIDGVKIKNGVLLSSNATIDGGVIEVDGVFNAFKFHEYHINSGGENGNDILDINIWEIEDGGEI